jgi:anti-anti-sigma regulatory factor
MSGTGYRVSVRDGHDPRLRAELRSQDRTSTLVLRGTLGTTSIAALEAQVDQLGCIPCDDVVVDVGGLTALDPVGAKVLLGLYHYVGGRGGTLRITGATGAIATILSRYAIEYAEADGELARAIDDPGAERHPGSAGPPPGFDGGQALLA